MILITHLNKTYQTNGLTTQVLKNVNLTVHEGEALLMVGASGAGKSTLLNIIGSLDYPTSGSVLIRGEDLFSKSEKQLSLYRNRMMGFVFQFHHLLPDFNALENVAMPLLIRGIRKKEAYFQASHLLEKVGLEKRGHHRPAELSGGEQQRVAIARALVGNPQILLADEPTGNLDYETGNKIFDLLLTMNRELRVTLIIVTHNEAFTEQPLKVVRLVDGQIDSL